MRINIISFKKLKMRKRIKICCISSILESKLAIKFGADALGLVSNMPSGPGVISDRLIIEIIKTIPPPISSFLLTSRINAEGIISQHKKINSNTIQLVDAVDFETYKILRKKLSTVKLVQVIHVLNEHNVEDALVISEHVDALLLDSGNPNLDVKILGGTGITHNWALSRKICELSKAPVFLAGGINAENVKQANEEVNPFGFDLCSSVRSNGKLDEFKLGAFFEAVEKI